MQLDKKEEFKGSLFVGAIGFAIAATINVATTIIVTSLPVWLIIPITIVYPILIYLWHNETMKDTVGHFIAAKRAKNESWWLTLGISLVAVVVNYLGAIAGLIIIAYFQSATIN